MSIKKFFSIKKFRNLLPLTILFLFSSLNIMFDNGKILELGVILFMISSIYLILFKGLRIKDIFSIELIIVNIYILTSFFVGYKNSSFSIILILFLLHCLFVSIDYDEDSIVDFVNYTFLFFLIISILVYFEIIHINREFNIFDVSFFGDNIKTFIGIGGSTSQIDSYGGFVFLFNLLINRRKYKFIWASLGFASMLLTFRMTPLIALLAVGLYYILTFKSPKLRKITFLLVSFLSSISFIIPYYINKSNFNFTEMTHARDIIWNLYIDIIKDFRINEFLFGIRDIPETYVSWSALPNKNPHSSFLTYLLYYGVVIFIIYMFFIIKKFLNIRNYKYQIILIFIFIVCITNGSILSLDNPIYIIIIYYMMYSANYAYRESNRIKLKG